MVGIPRSKGCKSCRRMKIKCDEQKPGCGQCRKGARACEGYDQPTTIFRHSSANDFTNDSHSQVQSTIQFKDQPIGPLAWVNGDDVRGSGRGRMTPRPKRPRQRVHPQTAARLRSARAQLAGPPTVPRTPDSLVSAVQSITGQFLELCAPPSSSAEESPLAWLGEIRPTEQDMDALPLAISALALGWAGHVDERHPRLADQGLQLYNAAIRRLRDDVHTRSPLQSLVVTAVLAAFELCQFGSRDNPGWLAHMQGIAAFLQAVGPDKVSVDPYVKIYSFCRVLFIMQGLSRRRPVCAGSYMWMHGPFRNRAKNAYHRFYDLAAEACGLLGRADSLAQPDNDGNAGTERETRVLRDILDLISRLDEWMRDSDVAGLNGPPRFPSDDAVSRHRLDRAKARGYPTRPPPDSGWTRETLYWRRLVCGYWALRLDLCMTVLDSPVLGALLLLPASASASAAGPGASRSDAASLSGECRALAGNIALHCAGGACHTATQSFGSLVAVYVLETAVRWYDGHRGAAGEVDRELERHCRAMLAGIRTEEAKDPCAFEVSVLPDEVLRRHWC